MKTTLASLKKQEAKRRMTALKSLKNGTRTAEQLQREASLVDGSKGRITNFAQVLQEMGKWAVSR
ncbi:MAG: hypothetical protein ABJC04_03720 [Verrucomicrobiota bacterium]